MIKSKLFLIIILSIFINFSFISIKSSNAISDTISLDTQVESKNTASIKFKLTGFDHPYIEEYEMPITGLITPPSTVSPGNNPSFITRRSFEIFKEAGFDILVPCYERPTFKEPEVRRGLEYCSDLGIVYLSNDSRIRCEGSSGANSAVEVYEELLKGAWYAEYESYGGVATKDEPNYDDFNEMAKGKKALDNVDSNKLFFTTLFPAGASLEQLHLGDRSHAQVWEYYVQYVDGFIDIVKPNLLVYDQYMWSHEGATRVLTADTSRSFFRTMSLYRNRALELGVPFWTTVATYRRSHIKENVNLTTKELSWVVNASLAYGSKGMSYYTYWPTIEGYNESWCTDPVRDGLVTGNGTRHDTYYKIQELNNNIKVVDEKLLPAKHLGMMQFGTFKNDLQEIDVLESCAPLKNITGGDAFVGCFELEGKKMYYIVNNSITAGITTFKCDFINKVNASTLNLKYGQKTYEDVYSVAFNLSAGEAILLEIL